MSNIGERLSLGLTALSLSGAELARRAGLPNRHMISRLKSGDRPAVQHLDAIASALGATREWLVNGTGEAPSWAKAAATDRMVRETTALYQAKEAGDQNAAILWEIKKLNGKIEEHLREDAERWRRIEVLLTNLASWHPAAVGVEPRQVAG